MSKAKRVVWGTATGYVAGVRGKVKVKSRILSPAEIRRSLNLSAASKRRVAQVLAELGYGRKAS